jgi:hypothetical protein
MRGSVWFIRAFISAIPSTERGALTTAEGHLSAEGLTRARNAVLAKAYGDAEVLASITESTDSDIRSVANALMTAAPQWAKLRSDIGTGRVRPDLDATPALVEAVKRTADLRNKGEKLETFLAQQDAFERLPGMVEGFMRSFYDPRGKRAATAKAIADTLQFYAEEASKVTTDPALNLGLPKVTADELQRAALASRNAGAAPGARPGPEKVGAQAKRQPTGKGGKGHVRSGHGGKLGEPADLFGEEPGVKGKPQLIIPGAERASEAELAKSRAAQPLKPKVAQKAIEHGLFGEETKQTDLVDQVRKAEAEARMSPDQAFAIADQEWGKELQRQFGKEAGDARYTKRGQGQPGTALRTAYDARETARQRLEAERQAKERARSALKNEEEARRVKHRRVILGDEPIHQAA